MPREQQPGISCASRLLRVAACCCVCLFLSAVFIPHEVHGAIAAADPGTTVRIVGNVTTVLRTAGTAQGLINTTSNTNAVLFAHHSPGSVRMLYPNGSEEIIAGSGAASSVDGIGLSASFNNPWGIARSINDNDTVFVVDYSSHCMRRLHLSNRSVVAFVGRCGIHGSIDGVGTAARFRNAADVVLFLNASTGREFLMIVDSWNHVVRRVDVDTATVEVVVGTGAAGDSNGDRLTQATFNRPISSALDDTGRWMYLVDRSNCVRKIDMMPTPGGGNGDVSTLAGNCPVPGFVDGIGSAARFAGARALTINRQGTVLYIAEYSNCAIRRVLTASGLVTTLGLRWGCATVPVDGPLPVARYGHVFGIRYFERSSADVDGNAVVEEGLLVSDDLKVIRYISLVEVTVSFSHSATGAPSPSWTSSPSRASFSRSVTGAASPSGTSSPSRASWSPSVTRPSHSQTRPSYSPTHMFSATPSRSTTSNLTASISASHVAGTATGSSTESSTRLHTTASFSVSLTATGTPSATVTESTSTTAFSDSGDVSTSRSLSPCHAITGDDPRTVVRFLVFDNTTIAPTHPASPWGLNASTDPTVGANSVAAPLNASSRALLQLSFAISKVDALLRGGGEVVLTLVLRNTVYIHSAFQGLSIASSYSAKAVVDLANETSWTDGGGGGGPLRAAARVQTIQLRFVPIGNRYLAQVDTLHIPLRIVEGACVDATSPTLAVTLRMAPFVPVGLDIASSIATTSLPIAAVSSPVAAVAVSRLSILKALIECSTDLEENDGNSLLDWPFGPVRGQFMRGAVVGNTLLVLAIVFLTGLIAYSIAVVWWLAAAIPVRASVEALQDVLHLPGIWWPVVVGVLQPTMTSAVQLIVLEPVAGDRVMGCMAAAVWLFVVALPFSAVMWRQFCLELVPRRQEDYDKAHRSIASIVRTITCGGSSGGGMDNSVKGMEQIGVASPAVRLPTLERVAAMNAPQVGNAAASSRAAGPFGSDDESLALDDDDETVVSLGGGNASFSSISSAPAATAAIAVSNAALVTRPNETSSSDGSIRSLPQHPLPAADLLLSAPLSPQHDDASATTKQKEAMDAISTHHTADCRGRVVAVLMVMFVASRHWEPAPPPASDWGVGGRGADAAAHGKRWKQRYLFVFVDSCTWWYPLVDLWTAFAVGIVGGLTVGDATLCHFQLGFLSFVYLIGVGIQLFFVTVLLPISRVYIAFVQVLGLVGCIAIAVVAVQNKNEETLALTTATMTMLAIAALSSLKGALDVAAMVLSISSVVRAVRRSYRHLKAAHHHKSLHPQDINGHGHARTEVQLLPPGEAAVRQPAHDAVVPTPPRMHQEEQHAPPHLHRDDEEALPVGRSNRTFLSHQTDDGLDGLMNRFKWEQLQAEQQEEAKTSEREGNRQQPMDDLYDFYFGCGEDRRDAAAASPSKADNHNMATEEDNVMRALLLLRQQSLPDGDERRAEAPRGVPTINQCATSIPTAKKERMSIGEDTTPSDPLPMPASDDTSTLETNLHSGSEHVRMSGGEGHEDDKRQQQQQHVSTITTETTSTTTRDQGASTFGMDASSLIDDQTWCADDDDPLMVAQAPVSFQGGEEGAATEHAEEV